MSFNELLMSVELGLIYGIVAMGIYLSFKILDIADLTCDGSFVLGGAVSGSLLKAGFSPVLGVCIALMAGGAAGMVTGILGTRFKISPLLSGILVAFMLYSINLKIMGGVPNITLFNERTLFGEWAPLYSLIGISLGLWIILGYLLRTDFGLALRSVGQNQRLAISNGINITNITVFVLALSNGLIALAGALFSQHQGFADVGGGIGTIIIALASVLIGERILPFKSTWVGLLNCLLGAIFYRLFISLALHSEVLGLETQDLNLLTGLLIIIVMTIPRRRLCYT